jgi:hypothetical protein
LVPVSYIVCNAAETTLGWGLSLLYLPALEAIASSGISQHIITNFVDQASTTETST